MTPNFFLLCTIFTAAKKAAEHIRSGLSNVVAARLIIEDEMESTTRKKSKGDKTHPLKNSMDVFPGTPTSMGGKKPKRGKSPFQEGTAEDPSLGESSSKQRSRKRVLSKG